MLKDISTLKMKSMRRMNNSWKPLKKSEPNKTLIAKRSSGHFQSLPLRTSIITSSAKYQTSLKRRNVWRMSWPKPR